MDTMYFQPQTPQFYASNPYFRYIFMSFVLLFSVISLFFLPVDIAAIQMSLDPGFTIFFILVLIIFLTKMLCLVDFYLILFGGSTAAELKMISFILQIVGSVFVGVSLIVVAVEIYILTNMFIAVLVHPFVIDFFLFMICNVLSYLVMNETTAPVQGFAYVAVPQQQQSKAYPMMTFAAPTPEPEIVEVPMQPMPSIKYPELPTQAFTEQMPFVPQLPKFFEIAAMQATTKKPEAPKAPVQPKAETLTFVPYYVMPPQ